MEHRTSRRLVAVCASAIALVGLAACGTETLDTSDVERTIATQFKAQGIVLTDVECPGEIEASVGAAVKCTGLNEARTKLFIEGDVNKRTDKGASFAVEAVRGEARGSVVAEQAKVLLEEKVGEPAKSMTCPKVVETPTRTPVECVLTTLEGTRYPVQVSFDRDNRLSAQVGDEPLPG